MKKQKKEKVITVADVGFDMAADAGAAVGSFFAVMLMCTMLIKMERKTAL